MIFRHVTRCAYAAELLVKMADEEAEQDHGERVDASDALNAFSARLEEIAATLNNSVESPDERASQYCYEFCQVRADCLTKHGAAALINMRTATEIRSPLS